MKIRIKLENGFEFSGNLSAEQLERAEHTRLFIKANKKKSFVCGGISGIYDCEKCSKFTRCNEKKQEMFKDLSNYLNYLKKLN